MLLLPRARLAAGWQSPLWFAVVCLVAGGEAVIPCVDGVSGLRVYQQVDEGCFGSCCNGVVCLVVGGESSNLLQLLFHALPAGGAA